MTEELVLETKDGGVQRAAMFQEVLRTTCGIDVLSVRPESRALSSLVKIGGMWCTANGPTGFPPPLS